MTDRKPSSVQTFSVREFFKRFPDDDSCLQHIMDVRYGTRHDCEACGVVNATFHKIAGRRCYSCAQCGHHVYPCAGTIFQDSRTPLQVWFYAIYLFVTTRHGVSGKELQRTLGVTYKTAWRMGQQIRDLMSKTQDFSMLQGHVELDEAYVGGRSTGVRGRGATGKTIVMGLKERGGRIQTKVVRSTKTFDLKPVVLAQVAPGSIISTDELTSYNLLASHGYQHGRVKHKWKEYARRDRKTGINHHVNNVESFWRLFKKSVASTHIHVSPQHMQRYLDEFTFRSNHGKMVNGMFDLLIGAI